MRTNITLLYFLLPFILADIEWPKKRNSSIDGDLYLVGFFPVHEGSDTEQVCGKITEEGMQMLETFLYSVREINKDNSILPNIRLGALAYDSCRSTSHALELALDLMYGFIATNQYMWDQLKCKDDQRPEYVGNLSIAAVIGDRSSDVTIQLANFLRVFQTPQISYKATAPTLSNINLYKHFFRTVAPINYMIEVIWKILKHFNWTYISIVYSDTAYGHSAYDSLIGLSANENLCFAAKLIVNDEKFTDSEYDLILTELLDAKARAVVILGEESLARKIMSASKRKQIKNHFVWLGVEAWANRDYAVRGYEEYAEGALCIGYTTYTPPDLFEYFQDLRPDDKSNPWFYELWEMKHQCRLRNFSETPYNKDFPDCTGSEDAFYMKNMPSAQLVRDAVYSAAIALNNLQMVKCNGIPGYCDEMKNLDGKLLREYLLNVTVKDEKGNVFSFNALGDAPPRYNIVNYRKNETDNRYRWEVVGTYEKDENNTYRLHLDEQRMAFKYFDKKFPESVCSKPCAPGEIKVSLDNSTCCWKCFNCSGDRYVVSKEGMCVNCDNGYKPNDNKTSCEEIPETYMDYKNPYAVMCIMISGFGILATVTVSIIFWKHWDTPIIKASARELSAILLWGIFWSFSVTFAIVKRPTTRSCGLIRFFFGFDYTVCYSAILVKTRRIALIFEAKGRKRSHYLGPYSQMLVAAAVISIEVIINATWLMYDPPSTDHYRTTKENILICSGSDRSTYLIGILYPFLLMLLCTVYAFKTRKCPEGFNEARHITFTNYTTCVIWLVFISTFTSQSSNDVRTVMLSLLLSLSAAVQIVCMFLPKVYMVLMRPEDNTKDTVMRYAGGPSFATSSSSN